MKIATIYDIHANPTALLSVLKDIQNYEVDLIVIGGDVIAGPFPTETLTILTEIKTPTKFILGNAESEVIRYINGKPVNGLSNRANEEAKWVANQISSSHKTFIKNWSKTFQAVIKEVGTVLFCHATPGSDIEIFTRISSNQRILKLFDGVRASIIICGHTHMPFDLKFGKSRIINSGSVGMPFGTNQASWLLIDQQINFMTTSYDIQMAAQLISTSNYPYKESFIRNNVLNVPEEQKALNMLESMAENQEKHKL